MTSEAEWVAMAPLLETDWAFCKFVAGLRTLSARGAGQKRPFNDRDSAVHITQEERGVVAEYAFCRHVNRFTSFAIGGYDGGYDCVLNGFKVDVKSIGDPTHNLVLKPNVEGHSETDMFVLVYVDGPKTWIVGWLEKERALQEKYVRQLHTQCFLIPRGDLNPWGE